MNISRLIISGNKEVKNNYSINKKNYYYFINFDRVTYENEYKLNDPKRLHEIAYQLRSEYVDWVYEQNQYFLSNKLIYQNDLSLFFLTDFSCKRNDMFSTFEDLANIKLIYELILKYKFKEIHLYNLNQNFVSSLISYISHLEVNVITREIIKSSRLKDSLTFNFLASFYILFKYLVVTIYHKLLERNNFKVYEINKLFLTRFPINFKKFGGFKEDKYYQLPKGMDYLGISILSDGLLQSISLKDYFQSYFELRKTKKKFIILDKYCNFKDIFKVLWLSFIYLKGFYSLSKKEFVFEGINISSQIKKEINFSFRRVIGTLISQKIFSNFIRIHKFNKIIYYLHEYPYGRMVSYTLNKYRIKKSIGMQHGLSSKLFLIYSLSKEEINKKNSIDFLQNVPLPESVWADDLPSREIYQEAGYKNVILMKNIPRMEYLFSTKLDKKNDIHLIAPSLRDDYILLGILLNRIINNPKINFLCKLHPHSNFDFSRFSNISNLKFTNISLNKLLMRSAKVYVTSSTVGYEAYLLKIPVEIIYIPGKLNLSNLLNINKDF